MLDPKTLTERDQKVLNTLIYKDLNDLTEDDKAVLRARQDYLTDEQKARLGTDIVRQVNHKDVIREQQAKAEEKKEEDQDELEELQQRAQELGINTEGLSSADLEVAISTILGPQADEE